MARKCFFGLAAAGLLAISGEPAAAATTAPPVCQLLVDHMAEVIGHGDIVDTPALKVDTTPDSCTFRNLQVNSGRIIGWSADRIMLTSPGIGEAASSTLPKVLQIDITGIRFHIRIDDTHARYLNEAVQRGFDIHLSYVWDDQARQLHVREATLESPWIGRASLAADFDLSGAQHAPDDLGDDGGIALRRVHFVLDNRAIIEGMMLPLLVGLIPKDKDPAVEFPKIQHMIEQQAHALPGAQADDASKDALILFVRDFPHPTGHFEETVSFDQPLGLDVLSSDKKAKWLREAHIEAVYSPAPTPNAPSTSEGSEE